MQFKCNLRAATAIGAILCSSQLLAQTTGPTNASAPPATTQGDPTAVQAIGPTPQGAPTQNTRRTDAAGEIVVTGSRVRGVAPVGTNLISISAAEIQKTPAANVADLVKRVPQISGLGYDQSNKNGAGPGGSGTNAMRGTSVNLRGLGPQATLVLVNGDRLARGGPTGNLADPENVPSIALDRIEIVADGSSAIYGSDAVAGVVNFITRTRYTGTLLSGRYSIADGDHHRLQLDALTGINWDTGHLVLAAEYYDQNRLNGTQRSFVRSDLTPFGGKNYADVQCNPGNIVVGGVSYAIPAGGVTPANSSALVPNTRNRCDNYRLGDILPHQERQQGYASLTQDVTDNLQVYARAIYSYRKFALNDIIQGTGGLAATLTVPSTNAFFVAPPGVTLPLCPASVAVPGGTQCETVQYFFTEAGLLDIKGHSENFMGTGGLALKLPHQWRLDANLNYAVDNEILDVNGTNSAAINAALRSNSAATALDPFGLGRTQPSVISGLFNNLFEPTVHSVVKTGRATLTGPLFNLGGGPVRLAVGAEHNYFLNGTGSRSGAPGSQNTILNVPVQKVDSLYGELFIPIVGVKNGFTGLEKLEVSLAGRIDRYSDVGTTRNPKIGVNYVPVDGLTFKGTYGTSFRAPATNDNRTVRAGSGFYVVTVADPQSPTGSSVGIVDNNGNPSLTPETAKTYTLTAELAPRRLRGFSASATWFSIDYKNQILNGQTATILSDPNQAFRIFARNPTSAQVNAYIAGSPLAGVLPPTVSFLANVGPLNSGGSKVQGFDFATNYNVETGFGHWSFGATATLLTKYAVSFAPNTPFVNELNTIVYSPKFKARLFAGWDYDGWTAEAYLNHTVSYRNIYVTPVETVKSYTTVDVGIGYQVPEGRGPLSGVSLQVRADNVFNQRPPYVNIIGGYDPNAASPVGRLVSFTIAKKF